MNTYEQLKDKWLNAELNYGPVKPGIFCVYVSETVWGGHCGGSMYRSIFFETAYDAMAYFRFSGISDILKAFFGVEQELGLPESYLENADKDVQDWIEPFQEVLDVFDKALNTIKIEKTILDEVQEKFNATFIQTSPQYEILAWGKLTDYLKDPYFEDPIDEMIEAEKYEIEQQEGLEFNENNYRVACLKQLLNNGEFDENRPEHLELAEVFLDNMNQL